MASKSCNHSASGLLLFLKDWTRNSSPTAALLMHILAAVAQFERELIRERVAAGIKAAQKNGTKIGRPKVVFDRAQAVERRAAGDSWRDIPSALKVGVGTVRRAYHSVPKTPSSQRAAASASQRLRVRERLCQNHHFSGSACGRYIRFWRVLPLARMGARESKTL
jgi:hypothetical protein